MVAQIGIDIGGTFTDAVMLDEGRVTSSKVLTTQDLLVSGVLENVRKISAEIGVDSDDLLSGDVRFVNGTTVVTNAIAELKGAKVGLIVTQGTRDTLRHGNSQRNEHVDLHKQLNRPDLVPRDCIVELNGRVDYSGRVVVPLDRAEIERKVRWLVEEKGVEAFAVCLLWSFKNQQHERLIGEVIADLYPDHYLTLSCQIYPVIREYERMVTTVLNSFTGKRVAGYIHGLVDNLQEAGFRGNMGVIDARGGSLSVDEVVQTPITLLNSGPVGGVLGANYLGQLLGLKNIITADMGGTSFDVSLIRNNEVVVKSRGKVNGLLTGLTMVDINAIGAGGGSIAWIDERGMPRIGPQSAGSNPGPACYGQGGEEPTTTDAAVALNLIDLEYFHGGTMQLDKQAAEKALQTRIAEPLGFSVTEAARAIYTILIATMSTAVHSVSLSQGHDPRNFTIVAYGGASGLFIADIARAAGVNNVIIPNHAAVFSAFGLLHADDQRSYVRSALWQPGQPFDDINKTYDELVAEGVASLHRDGYSDEQITVIKEADLQYTGQIWDVTIPMPAHRFTEADEEAIGSTFTETYERLYGKGTGWVEAGVQLVACRVRTIGQTEKPDLRELPIESSTNVKDARTGSRLVHMPMLDQQERIDVYRREGLKPGAELSGPCIIEASDTTVFVPTGAHVRVDSYNDLYVQFASDVSRGNNR